jgi:PAS domain S-box-containing protein
MTSTDPKIHAAFRALFETLPGLHLAVLPNDPEFTIVAISDAAAHKIPRREFVGQPLSDAFCDRLSLLSSGPVDMGRLTCALSAALRQKTPQEISRCDGQEGRCGPGDLLAEVVPVISADGSVESLVVKLHGPQSPDTGLPRRAVGDTKPEVQAESRQDDPTDALEIINELGQTIAAERDLNRLVQSVTDVATTLTGAQFGAFFYNVLNESGESYYLYTLSGVPREAFAGFPMPRNTQVFAHTFNGVGNVRLDDVRNDPRYGKNPPYYGMPAGHLPVVSYLAVPVTSRAGEVLGGLFFGHPEPGRFTERHERIVTAIASQAAVAMDNARLYEAVTEREDRLNAAMEASGVGTWDFHPQTGDLRWDDRCKAIFGLPPEARVTYDLFLNALHPDDRDRVDQAVKAALDPNGTHEFECEYRVVGIDDGTVRWASAKGRSYFPKSGSGQESAVRFVGSILDITTRRALEEQQARMAALVASSEDAIVSKDLNGIVTSWNASAERIYGWPAEEIVGRSKALVIPPDLPNELPAILAKIRAGERIDHYETRRIRKDGTIFDAAISVSPVRDTTGAIIGAATIVRDITERKAADRELLHRQEQVERLNERLKRAMQETHHRVKNNLQIVGAMIDMQVMEHMAGDTLPLSELRRLGTHIRTLAVVHDMLTKSLRESEDDQLVSSSFVLDELLNLLVQTSGTRHIETQLADVPIRSKHALSLSLILNELVSNAVKHASDTVEVVFAVEGNEGRLSVRDNGPGFPVGFDPLRHANTGLELVQVLAETDLKGEARFENRPTGGACVTILFAMQNAQM